MAYDVSAVIEYYKNLLLYQWINATRARGMIGVGVDTVVCDLLPLAVRDAFEIGTAEGTQLDVLGEYIGFSRTVFGELDRPYFQLNDYVSPMTDIVGLTDYTDRTINAGSVTYRYAFAREAVYTLEDEEYRFMLKLKSELNALDNTLYGIQNALWNFLGDDIRLFDLRDMSISYYIKPTAGRFAQLAASQGLLPKPMGVTMSGVFEVPDPSQVFGLQDYVVPNANTTGFSMYPTGASLDSITLKMATPYPDVFVTAYICPKIWDAGNSTWIPDSPLYGATAPVGLDSPYSDTTFMFEIESLPCAEYYVCIPWNEEWGADTEIYGNSSGGSMKRRGWNSFYEYYYWHPDFGTANALRTIVAGGNVVEEVTDGGSSSDISDPSSHFGLAFPYTHTATNPAEWGWHWLSYSDRL